MLKKLFLCTLISILSMSMSYAQQNIQHSESFKVLENGTIELIFSLDIEPEWHLYGSREITDGPLPFTFIPADPGQFEIVRGMKDELVPEKEVDPTFGMEVEYFEYEAQFSIRIRPKSSLPMNIKGTIRYQVCNGGMCGVQSSDIEFNIR